MAEVPEAEAPAAAPAKAGKGKLIVIIVAAVLLLGGGGAGAYFAFGGSHDEEQVDEEAADEADAESDEKPGKKAKGKKDKKGKKKPSAPAVYYKVDPALVVNFESGGVTRFLQVAVEISTRDPLMVEELKLHDPVIRNDLLMLLGNQQHSTVSTREGKEQLRVQALEAVRNVINNEGGEGSKVEAVYFTSFVMQ